jgi:pimeloyl-ACP methyl ester carboxylesterase
MGVELKARYWIVCALVGVVLVAVLVAGWYVRYRPLTLYTLTTRSALQRAGLRPLAVESPAGRQVVFRGGNGPTLVLLHGAGDQAGAWFRVVPELEKRYTLLVPDLAGHGDSAPSSGPIDVPMILGGVEAALEHLAGGQKVTLVGNSLGAWIAMLVAHRHPGWVERVVAVDGGAITGHHAVNLLPKDRAQARETVSLLRDPGSPAIPDFVLDDIVRQARTGPLARFAATSATMDRWTLDGRLGEIGVPVELIWGESDRLIPLDYARTMLRELPSAHLTTIPKCGHVPQQECPRAFLAALETALSNAT